jgi:ABC-type hemin transport system substrate-binding protein
MGQYWGMRIVSLLPSATEIVYALGLAEHLVGVEAMLVSVFRAQVVNATCWHQAASEP